MGGNMTMLARRLDKRAQTVFDVGANWGTDSIPFAEVNPDIEVHAFEPTPDLAAALREAERRLPNYHVHEVAISDADGEAPLNISEGHEGGCTSLNTFAEGIHARWTGRKDFAVAATVTVRTRRLAHVCKEIGVESIDILHVDTQGHDLKVLQSLDWLRFTVGVGVVEAPGRTKLYKESPSRREMARYLGSMGCQVFGIHRNDADVHEINLFFERVTNEPLHGVQLVRALVAAEVLYLVARLRALLYARLRALLRPLRERLRSRARLYARLRAVASPVRERLRR